MTAAPPPDRRIHSILTDRTLSDIFRSYRPHRPTETYYYHHPTPATPSYKTVMEVDFTPMFLALLPLFLCVGTLLGLGVQPSETAATVPSITVNVNASSSSGGSSGPSSSSDGVNQTIVPLLLFTNGTYLFPLLTGLTSSLLGFGSIFGLFPFTGFGRSFSEAGWSDAVGLFGLYEALAKVENIEDEKDRLSCFSWTLCHDDEEEDNIFIVLAKYCWERLFLKKCS